LQVQATAVGTFVSLLDSIDRNTRQGVLDYLSTHSWPQHLYGIYRNGMTEFVRTAQHCGMDELQRAFSMVPGNNIRPPLALLLYQMGVHPPTGTDFRELAQQIVLRSNNDSDLAQRIALLQAAASWQHPGPE